MTDIEGRQFELRIQLAEHRSTLADLRSQLALHVVTALRDVLALRSPEFDAEYVRQLKSMPALSIPSEDQLDAPAKLTELIQNLEKIRQTLEKSIHQE